MSTNTVGPARPPTPGPAATTVPAEHALDIARQLAAAGVPLFLARPAGRRTWDPAGGTGGSGYWLPRAWQQTDPDPAVVDRWEPGTGLAAVMGHVVDGLDVDPRHGGTESLQGLPIPTVYGVQGTPSGGWHGLIAPLGTGSRDAVRAGVDVKGGRPDGAGRGFLWLAPTVKLSKVTGEITGYRWIRPPELTGIEADTSGTALADVIRGLRQGDTAPTPQPTVSIPATGARLLVGLVDVVLQAPQGERNSRLHWAACRAAEHDLAGRLDWQSAGGALSAAAAEIGLSQREILATLRSGYRSIRGGAA